MHGSCLGLENTFNPIPRRFSPSDPRRLYRYLYRWAGASSRVNATTNRRRNQIYCGMIRHAEDTQLGVDQFFFGYTIEFDLEKGDAMVVLPSQHTHTYPCLRESTVEAAESCPWSKINPNNKHHVLLYNSRIPQCVSAISGGAASSRSSKISRLRKVV